MPDKPNTPDFVVSEDEINQLQPFTFVIRGKRYTMPSSDQVTLDEVLTITQAGSEFEGLRLLLEHASEDARKAVGSLPQKFARKLLDAWADRDSDEPGESSPSES